MINANEIEIVLHKINLLTANNFCSLDLEYLNLTSLPDEIFKLTKLLSLNLKGNKLANLSPKLKNLKGLRILILSRNQLEQIPAEIGELLNLEYLYIDRNQLLSIPKEIGSLTNLKTLDLSNNQLNTIPATLGKLRNLKNLFVSNNRLKYFPKEMKLLKNLELLEYMGNTIVPPIEITKDRLKEILNFYVALFEKDKIKLNEAKLLIVGEGGVGKSTLMKRIINPTSNPKSNEKPTEGIKINQWNFTSHNQGDLIVNIWDFGGQDIYHATHQFFLTKRSIYLFLWDPRKDDDLLCFDYWLNLIKLLSNESPVFVIQNKIDEHYKIIDEVSIKNSFPNIVGFHRISAYYGNGVTDLLSEIKKRICKLEHIGDPLPKVWIEIRKDLQGLNKNYITYMEYQKICRIFNLTSEESTFLSQYFHDLGVFLNFKDNEILKDIVILKPEWATSAVYKLVNFNKIINKFGEFSYEDINDVWIEYSRENKIQILELMKKFELCFQIDNYFIIPSLLRPNRPNFDWDFHNNLKFEYHFKFMPKGIITRFIVRTHDLCKENIYWKNGVVLEREKTEAFITSDFLSRKIYIWIKGNRKKDLLSIIRREFDAIYKTLNYPYVEEMIPCVCRLCSKIENPSMFKFRLLIKYQDKMMDEIVCENSLENVSVNKLISGIEKTDFTKQYKFNINIENVNLKKTIISNKTNQIVKEEGMKINKVEISGGENVFSDNINRATFNKNFIISEEDFLKLKNSLLILPADQKKTINEFILKETKMKENNKMKLFEDLKSFLINNGIPIIHHLAGSTVFEIIKHIISPMPS